MANFRRGFDIVIAVWILHLCVGCSVFDDNQSLSQASFFLNVVDSTGAGVPSSNVTLAPLYCFVNGFYSRTLTPEADGTYRYVFGSEDSVCLVSLAGRDPSEYSLAVPREGESIHNVWLSLDGAASGEMSSSPSAVYYGLWKGTGAGFAKVGTDVPITLQDKRGKVHVLIKGLRERFGDGTYRVFIDGLRGQLAYDGTTQLSAMSTVELSGDFIPSTGDWLSKPVTTLTTSGNSVNVRLYKQDGTLLFKRNKDDDGQPLRVRENSDDVFCFIASQTGSFIVNVLPFEKVSQEAIFQ